MAKKKTGQIVVGTSGYTYDHWRGLFYPTELAKRKWFDYYTTQFSAVELNATFYRLFPESTFEKWHAQTPANFRYVLKLWRWITHRKRLSEIEGDLKTFLLRAELLKGRLGPILVQLPPGLHREDEKLDDFLQAWGRVQKELKKKFRMALEFRHKSWFDESVYAMLRSYRVCLCLPDMPKLKGFREVTTDFTYLRFHGVPQLYLSRYSDDELSDWAGWAKLYLKKGIDVYAFFNNDGNAHAVQNARQFRELLTSEHGASAT